MATISVLQVDPVPHDQDATFARLAPMLEEVRGTEVAVLPELLNSAYVFESREDAWSRAEEVSGSRFLARLSEAAGPDGPALVVGFCERAGGELYNSSVLLDRGEVVSVYRKLHLFNDEWDWCCPGDLPLEVKEVRGVRVGQLICFDWAFPEAWRVLALLGADLVALPSNLMLPGRCQMATPVHAMIQRYYVAVANRSGEENGKIFTGESLLAGPDGAVVARAPRHGDAVIRCSFEAGRTRDKSMTPRNDVLADRRPEFYGKLMEAPTR